jgi:OPT oligopeptide transporter protein
MIMIMLCYSFVEVTASAPIFWCSFKQVYCSVKFKYHSWSATCTSLTIINTRPVEDIVLDDLALLHEQVPLWAWTIGLMLSILSTLIISKLSFNMDIGISILALILTFLFSFISVQSLGMTDVNPIGTITKALQLVIGSITRGQGTDIKVAQTTNLIVGSIMGQAASHGIDMTL